MVKKTDIIRNSGVHKLFKPFYGGIGHAIMFHRILNEGGKFITGGLQVTQGYLDQIINYFVANDIDIVSLDECYRRINSKNKERRFVTFTFDDGYEDNLKLALPVFEKHNVPFSVFVTTGYQERKAILWWYLLEELFIKKDEIEFCYKSQHFCESIRTETDKRRIFARIKEFILESVSLDDYQKRLEAIFIDSGFDLFDYNKEKFMTREQIKELANHSLATIGAHTVHHLSLKGLSNEEEVKKEIRDSVDYLEDLIGQKIEYFAYPYGTEEEASEREYRLAKECGIKMAFTTVRKNISRNQAKSLMSVPRVGINNTMDLTHIDLFMNGLMVFYNKIINI